MTDHSEKLLAELVQQDKIYQELLSSCSAAEAAYTQVLHSLPEQAQLAVENYITLCEELDHRKLTLVLNLKMT